VGIPRVFLLSIFGSLLLYWSNETGLGVGSLKLLATVTLLGKGAGNLHAGCDRLPA